MVTAMLTLPDVKKAPSDSPEALIITPFGLWANLPWTSPRESAPSRRERGPCRTPLHRTWLSSRLASSVLLLPEYRLRLRTQPTFPRSISACSHRLIKREKLGPRICPGPCDHSPSTSMTSPFAAQRLTDLITNVRILLLRRPFSISFFASVFSLLFTFL